MLRATLLLVAAAAASDERVSVARFRRQLTPAFVRRLEAVLGYECSMYAPPDSLILYLDDVLTPRLRAHFSASLRSLTPLSDDQRCSPHLGTFGTRGEYKQPSTISRGVRLSGQSSPQPPPQLLQTPQHATLRLLLHPGAYASHLSSRSVTAWHEQIATALRELSEQPQQIELQILSHDLLHALHVPADQLERIARELVARVACICYVEIAYPEQLLNLWSAHTAQNASAISTANAGQAAACAASASCAPLWNAGISGASQLVAISDTGVSHQTCYFLDAFAGVPFVEDRSCPARAAGGATQQSEHLAACSVGDSGHRKLRAYWVGTSGDKLDADGHGSHVSGTVAGVAASGQAGGDSALHSADFNGVAPDARIVFIDAHTSGGGLHIPSPYDAVLFQFAYNYAAMVHTGSWGIPDGAYSDEDRRTDSFCWHHRDFLVIFAAGNSGVSRGAASILSPAMAKNALAIGATMPGFAPHDIAAGSTPEHEADAYAPDWIAAFSSRGGSAMHVPWMKPDLVASGGAYVWSANGAGPASCDNVAASVIGYSGTSMAAPMAAGAAALVRDFCERRARLRPTASLVKALLVGSATRTRGVFPLRSMDDVLASGSYAPYGRGYVEGHGKLDLVRALPLTSSGAAVTLVILSNEDSSSALPRANEVRRYCVALRSRAVQTVDASVVLAYTDYPSAAGTPPSLVNDLDLRLWLEPGGETFLHPNGLQQRDSMSPLEVFRLQIAFTDDGAVGVSLEVWSELIGFQMQSYSLALLVHAPNVTAVVNGVDSDNVYDGDANALHDTAANGRCAFCGANGDFVVSSGCALCGNGIVEAGEDCDVLPENSDEQPCCNTSNCSFYGDDRECFGVVVDRDCYVSGVCSSSSVSAFCDITPQSASEHLRYYKLSSSAALPLIVLCSPVDEDSDEPEPPPPLICELRSTPAWMATLAVNGGHELIRHGDAGDDRVCCRTFVDYAVHAYDGSGGAACSVLHERLARATIAATLNFRTGIATSSVLLAQLDNAVKLLDDHCALGFVRNSTARARAHALHDALNEYNDVPRDESCTSQPVPPPVPEVICVSEQDRADAAYCSGNGRYDDANDLCVCAPRYHADAHCGDLHCNGHGASVTSADNGGSCVCMPGWAGAECRSCAAPPPLSGLTYLCVGIVRSLVPPELDPSSQHSHVLTLVDSNSVAERLAGAYYDASVTKARDAVPGGGGYDCWCASPGVAVHHSDYASHADALHAAAAYWSLRDALWALGEPPRALAASPPALPPTSPPPAPRPTSGAAAVSSSMLLQRILCLLSVAKILLWW